jgi:hypothetical protein
MSLDELAASSDERRGKLHRMHEPPVELDGAHVLQYAAVTERVEATGATRHVVAGVEFVSAAALAIAQYAGDDGFYLFYLNHQDEVVTDTLHDSLQTAFDQAAFEYRGLAWVDLTSP